MAHEGEAPTGDHAQPAAGSGVLRGSVLLSVGLGVSGLGTLVMVGIAARGLPPAMFAAFSTWWLTVAILAPLLGVFEVYLARCLLAREAAGGATRRVTAQLFGLALAAIAVIAVITLPLAPFLADRVFHGEIWAPLLIPVFAGMVALQSVQRGVAVGRRQFAVIAVQLSADGVLRALFTGVVVAFGAGSWVYLAPVASGVVALLFVSPKLPGWLTVPQPLSHEVPVRPIAWLLVASGGPVLIGNAIAPWFAAVQANTALVAGFSAALLVSRLPTQLASAAFAPVMTHMSQEVDQGDTAGLRATRRKAIAWSALVGGLFVGGFALLGPWALSLYVGAAYSVPRWALALLAATSAILLVATIQQAALTAANRWGVIALAWTGGAMAFLVTLKLPLPALVVAGLAPLVGVSVAAAAMAPAPKALVVGRP